MDILWSMLIFMGFIMWFWLAVSCFGDIFRRRDMGGFVKSLWIIVIIFIPLFGVLVYLIGNHNGIAERSVKAAEAQQAAFDQQVREAAGTGGPAGEIAAAQQLLDAGTITQVDFDALKAKALSR
jgi:hypothetical protein